MEKVGVIIPVKANLTPQENLYLQQCLDSIEHQTYESCYYYMYQGDQGIAYNINVAAHEAIKDNCQFVFVMSADDWMEPNCIELALQQFKNNPDCGFVSCGLRRIPGGVTITKPNITYSSQLIRNQIICFCLYPVSVWHEFGGYSMHYKDIALSSLEDYDLLTRIMKYYPYCIVDKPVINYRIHAEQTTNKIGNKNKLLTNRFNELRRSISTIPG